MDRGARIGLYACGAAAALAWLAIVASAVLFARLPAEGVSLAGLGWPVTKGLMTPAFVIVDEDGKEAWIAQGAFICRVMLVTGRVTRCDDVGESARAQHVAARDRLLLVVPDVSGRSARVLVLAARDGAPVTATIPLPEHASLVNAGFEATRGRFEIYIRSYDAGAIDVVPIGLDGVVAATERLALDADLMKLASALGGAQVVAVIPSPPSLVLWESSGRTAQMWNGRTTERIDVDAAACGSWAAFCVLPSSRVAFQSVARVALVIDSTGHVVRPRHEPGEPETLIVRRRPNAAEDFIASSHAGDLDARILSTSIGTDRVDFRVQHRGFESVLYARKGDGAWRAVARDDGTWYAFPHDDGIFLASTTWGGRSVSLDRNLERRDGPGFFGTMKNIIARRLQYAPLQVVVYFAALLAFPLLMIRARRRPDAPPTLALGAYATIVLLLLLAEGRNMFPPG